MSADVAAAHAAAAAGLLLLLLLLLFVGTLISRILGFGLLSITIGIVVTVDEGESLIGSVGLVLL